MIEKIKDLEEKYNKTNSINSIISGLCLNSHIDLDLIDDDGEICLPYKDKNYVLVANYRNTSIINKDEAITIIEINKSGKKEIKYTSINCLNEEEKKEFDKDGFIVIKNK